MFQLKLTATAKRELKNISERHQESLSEIFEDLKHNPSVGKPLVRELRGRFSYRIGPFRIVYTVNLQDQKVTIISAGHRSRIYKLPRQH